MNPTIKKLTFALAISVGLNLFIGGFVVARMAIGPRAMHPMGPPTMMGPGTMAAEIDDPALRQRFGAHFKAHSERFDNERRQLREARRKVAEELEREPPSREQLQAAFGALRQATTTSQTTLHDNLAEVAVTLTKEQRRQLVRSWMRERHHGRHGRK